jgi:hypothetical protein
MVLVYRAAHDEDRGTELETGHRQGGISVMVRSIVSGRVADTEPATEQDGGEEKTEETGKLECGKQVALEHAKVARVRARVFDERHDRVFLGEYIHTMAGRWRAHCFGGSVAGVIIGSDTCGLSRMTYRDLRRDV